MIISASSETWLIALWLIGGGVFLMALRPGRTARLLRAVLRSRAVPSKPPRPFTGKVFVIDGDTIHVRQARVRLFGMDAPGLTQRGGWKARSHLIRVAGGREVAVEPIDVDCDGRIVARVWLGRTDLSEQMVRDGYARGLNDWCADYAPVEFEARRNKRGLWATTGIDDPAAHRRLKSRTAPLT